MTKTEKNALGKVSVILQVVWLSLNSALNALRIYAPNQIKLFSVLGYITAVIEAVIKQRELPPVPIELQPKDSFSANFALSENAIESTDDYKNVTASFGDLESSFDLTIVEEDSDDVARTK